jgi:hypothetical protein
MRGTFESSEERSSLIDLVSAMVGFGPTAPHGNVRKVAERVMGERVYTTFFRTFLTVFELPQGMPLSDRTVFELSSYPQDLLLNDDNVLTFLVTYAPCVNDFYMQTSTDNRVTQHLPGFITMSSLLDKLVAVHRKFYAG